MGWMVNATPRPLYPQERPGTHCTGGWVDPRAGLDRCGKSVAIPTELSRPTVPLPHSVQISEHNYSARHNYCSRQSLLQNNTNCLVGIQRNAAAFNGIVVSVRRRCLPECEATFSVSPVPLFRGNLLLNTEGS